MFLKACRGERTPYTPVWLMRQAGRYMKEYRELRDKISFLNLCRKPETAARITVEAQQKIGADAAIIFSDILLVVDALGLGLDYLKGDGPQVRRPVRSASDIDRLPDVEPGDKLAYVYSAIRSAKKSLNGVPLIGFAGAPFTIASYMIEGGASKDFARTKRLMRSDPPAWGRLASKIARLTLRHLAAQIEAGADCVQLFDSWVGALGRDEYKEHVLPHSRHVLKGLAGRVPVIHFGTGTGPFLEAFAEAGGDVIGVDHRMKLADAWKRIGPRAIQGNLDPQILLTDPDRIRDEAQDILLQAAGRPGHIFNLGHGVLPNTPVENVIALVDAVHELSRGSDPDLNQSKLRGLTPDG